MTIRVSRFTLLEVVIATAILAIALGAIMSVVGSTKADMGRAMDARAKQHSLQQATEWYLLANPANLELPDGLLPAGYQASCEIEDVVDELPEHAQEPRDGWILVRYVIEVIDDQGNFLGQNLVYRIIREDVE